MVERPEEYKSSSAAAQLDLAKDHCSLPDKNFWTDQGAAEGWAVMSATPEEAIKPRLLRRCTYAGWPLCKEEYLALLEHRFQRV